MILRPVDLVMATIVCPCMRRINALLSKKKKYSNVIIGYPWSKWERRTALSVGKELSQSFPLKLLPLFHLNSLIQPLLPNSLILLTKYSWFAVNSKNGMIVGRLGMNWITGAVCAVLRNRSNPTFPICISFKPCFCKASSMWSISFTNRWRIVCEIHWKY